MAQTTEEKKASIRALIEERRGYEMRGLGDRVKEVDKQLALLGHGAQKPSQRATQRSTTTTTATPSSTRPASGGRSAA